MIERPAKRVRPASPIILILAIVGLVIATLTLVTHQFRTTTEAYLQTRLDSARFRVEGLTLTQEALVRTRLKDLERSLDAMTAGPEVLQFLYRANREIAGVIVLNGDGTPVTRAGEIKLDATCVDTLLHEHAAGETAIRLTVMECDGAHLILSRATLSADMSVDTLTILVLDMIRFGDALDVPGRIPGMSTALLMDDGTVIFRRPTPPGDQTLTVLPQSLRVEHEETRQDISPFDGRKRMVSARILAPWPLTVAVTEDLEAALELASRYRQREAVRWGSIGAGLLILLVVLGRITYRYMLTARKLEESAERMLHMAQHDTLTGLPNRALLSDRTQQAIMMANRASVHLAVMYIDLDNFKPINDRYGHAAGDEVLREVARRIRACLRASDTPGRIGGDEFIVLLPLVDDPAAALVVGEKISHELSQPIAAEGRSLSVTASIGIALYPVQGTTEQELTRNADAAMYTAKQSGRDKVMVYDPATMS